MAVITIGVAEHESWSLAPARVRHEALRRFIHSSHVLPIHGFAGNAKGGSSRAQVSSSRLRIMGVFVVLVVLTHINDGKLPQCRHVHDLVEYSLAQRAIAKEAYRHLLAAAHLDRHGSPGSNARASAYNGIRAQVAGILVSDMHRTTLALTVTSFLAQQFGKHAVNRCSLCQAVSMPAMRAGDVVIAPQRRANADRDSLLPTVQVSQAGHLRSDIETVDMLLEMADGQHLLVHLQPVS